MLSKPLAFGLLALATLTAAAGGAYVATRQNAAGRSVSLDSPASRPAAAPAPAPAQPVAETEAPVTPPAAAPAATPSAAPVAKPRAAKPERATPDPVEHPGSRKSAAPPAPAPTVAARQVERTVPLPDRGSSATPPSAPQANDAAPAAPPLPAVVTPPDAARTPDSQPAPPPTPQFDELILPASSVIGLQLETPLTSERARIEDRVEARVTRDVVIGGRLAIPAGARVIGSVTEVDRGGKIRERARLTIRFNTLVLNDGTEVALRTEPIMREGDAPAPESARKIGGAAIGGAILGAILGGGKGAVIGGMTGAGGGTAAVMAGDRNPATFPAGAIVTARLSSPATIQVERRDQ